MLPPSEDPRELKESAQQQLLGLLSLESSSKKMFTSEEKLLLK